MSGLGKASGRGLILGLPGLGSVLGWTSALLAGAASGNSTKLASMGGGAAISTLGALRKMPNFHMIASQMISASGSGHHSLISLERKSGTWTRTISPQWLHTAW
jgi:hypothetical protein